MKKRLLLVLFVSIMLVGCSSSSDNGASYNESSSQAASYSHEYKGVSNETYDTDSTEQKIIKTAEVSMNVKNYDEAVKNIEEVMKDCGGYIEQSNTYLKNPGIFENTSKKDYRNGNLTLRIPSEIYRDVLDRILSLGKLIRLSESELNATKQYYDIAKRLETQTAKYNRLIEFIDKTNNIDELLKLEEELSETNRIIESYTFQLTDIDSKANYSTIQLEILESDTEEIKPIGNDFVNNIKNAFIASINLIINMFKFIILFISGAIIPVTLTAIIVFMIYACYMKMKRKNDLKKIKK